MVKLVDGLVYEVTSAVRRGDKSLICTVEVQAEDGIPYAIVDWTVFEGCEIAASRIRLDPALLTGVPPKGLCYSGRIEMPPDAPISGMGGTGPA